LKKLIAKLVDKNDPLYKLKLWIWVYFFMLIFEGALRKWFLPFLSTPLLLVRDPIGLYLIILSYKKDVMPKSFYIVIMNIVTVVSVFTTVFFGHGNLIVALYGARIMLLHFPVIFIIGNVFDRNDVIKMGKVTLWIAIPMAVLTALQFYSPQSAWVNRGVGGDEKGGGFSGALGFFRPPGTFSFTNGNSLFFSFVAPFVFIYWLYPKLVKKWLLIGGTIALLISIPLSISRALFFSVLMTLIFTIMAASRKPAFLKRIGSATVGIVLVFLVLSQTPLFQTAANAFTARFNGANESEGGLQSVILDRYLGGMVGAITSSGDFPFWGYGLGLGTNLGVQLVKGLPQVAEGEWGRIIMEQGFLLGILVIFIRVFFSLNLTLGSYKKLKSGDLIPCILLSFFLLSIPQSQWKQPTALGFSILIAGLQMASLQAVKRR
jgi:hypothetical protein